MISSMQEALTPDAGSTTDSGSLVTLSELQRAFRKLGKRIIKCACGCGDYRSTPLKGKQIRFILGHQSRVRTAATRKKLSRAATRLWESPTYRDAQRSSPTGIYFRNGASNPLFGKYGRQHPAWSGGRTLNSAGYVLLTIRPDHPHVSMAHLSGNGSYYVLEHRTVAAEQLGRPLKEHETVHHRNGDRADNRPENLLVLASNSEHMRLHAFESAGKSERDAIARIVLDRYPELS